MNVGKVYFVGAGPGDPKLITVRGREALEKADVVVYDRLASPRLLRHLKPGARQVYVGKLPDRHTLRQEEINQLLLDLALEGQTVVRLKGGDPAVFGRVGEEALLMAEHGIPYEWIPGISSAIAVPAYAGIPITHRGLTSSFAVVTGHECPKKADSDIDWAKVATATGTIVFLMGVKNLTSICEQLLLYGRAKDTPVAVIQWGTCSEQLTVTGTIETIAERVRSAAISSPAITIVGEVVQLREQLAWFEQKPLFGKKIVVTRARDQASELVERIEELGGEAIEFPLIRTAPVTEDADCAALADALERLATFDWLVFTSTNGVRYFFRELRERAIDVRRIRARVAAVGSQTAEALAEHGLIADLIPEPFRAEQLVPAFESLLHMEQLHAGAKVLLARAKVAGQEVVEQLASLGLAVTDVACYQTGPADEQDPYAIEQLLAGKVDVITFTSASTVRYFFQKMSVFSYVIPANCQTVCIGPVTAAAAREAGVQVTTVADRATIDSLVKSISLIGV